MVDNFLQYERQVTTGELRPYVPGEDLSKISVEPGYTPQEGDWIARDPKDRDSMWLVSRTYFEANYKPEPVGNDGLAHVRVRVDQQMVPTPDEQAVLDKRWGEPQAKAPDAVLGNKRSEF